VLLNEVGVFELNARTLAAEFLGTALLLAAVVGSGIMGERLSGGNIAVALLANTMATGTALVVLISIFGPVSGAHFNPAVTMFFALKREISLASTAAYLIAQLIGALCGVWIAHLMFEAPVFEISTKLRDGPAQAFSEFVATFGLIGTIAGALRYRPAWCAALVGLYISAAYWFTASTSFANPAVTIARALSNSFAGIAPHSVAAFIAAQLLGALAGYAVFGWLFVGESASIGIVRDTLSSSDISGSGGLSV
jgi:glycerol uptake facilitator-like aquaporin